MKLYFMNKSSITLCIILLLIRHILLFITLMVYNESHQVFVGHPVYRELFPYVILNSVAYKRK